MPKIDDRALNRARLSRSLLLGRSNLPVTEALERLAGLRGDSCRDIHIGLWARLSAYRPETTTRLRLDGEIVLTDLAGSRPHLVTAADCLWALPTLAPARQRLMRRALGPSVEGIDLRELTATGRAIVDRDGPLSAADLGRSLAAHGREVGWGERRPESLAVAVGHLTGLVAVPPREAWPAGGAEPVYMTVETWLGRRVAEPDPERLIRRRLAAAGPASVRELEAWSGLSRLAEVVALMDLPTHTGAAGETLLDLPGAEIPDPATPAPVRFLPGDSEGTVLVDGFPSATWELSRTEARATLRLRPARAFTPAEGSQVGDEATALLNFLAPGAEHAVEGL
ncbi:winged helix DNA-binding domain-containing protein [Phytomonospora sp. NPDC050363]|uniref:winged helix DNA-binding domain-containing protein n=1 Tax=Phytomonospora sp. NPDC050363 TaxID=3155642 RepID=UPI003403FD89